MSTTVDPGWTQLDRAKAAGKLMAGWVALLWLIELVDLATGHALDGYGITPRDPDHLIGVVAHPFLHFGFGHVASNSLPLLVLGFIAALGGIRRFLAVSTLIILAVGVGSWLTAPPNTLGAGASGLVFGLFGYVVVRGFVERKPLNAVVGVGVAAVWGSSIFLGVLPTDSGVGWYAHLIGLAAGVLTAFRHGRPATPAPTPVR
ncbi:MULTISPECIES: rhomboid family intramembrane serine protease [Streptomyces]|uniref:Rhomboid family intramembrane serine protease n=1 Tax=Streptomyces spororaveus TaxID=284039 RepID=A0ABQ3TDI8_9ACTN|nr:MULTISPECIES: rhomboid family intramembrane serine protease [Streptomyces]MCM9081123.1 rhomboid family intramembrane serine protease [Streptomyces spororaveus]MCX5304430.1 rhomboid family intramembrane serine protease [Streptomyces sp. NBC_00160]GHI78483.1 rhomboid family intramembrane serine protease [Streptomyces spororaveus]